jgi:hypothetical protein
MIRNISMSERNILLSSIKRFLSKGGVIVWGIVPTGFETFAMEDISSMILRLETVWDVLEKKGIDRRRMIEKSLLSPATCCLVNPDREKTVEKAFKAVKSISETLRMRYHLGEKAGSGNSS